MNKFYPIVVVPISAEDGGGYMGYVPDLKGCMSHGDTPEEALASTQEAALEWIDEAKEQGMAVPEPGAAAARVRQDRDRLIQTIKEQSQAIETMNVDIQKMHTDISALRQTLASVSEGLAVEPSWASIVAIGSGARKEIEDAVH